MIYERLPCDLCIQETDAYFTTKWDGVKTIKIMCNDCKNQSCKPLMCDRCGNNVKAYYVKDEKGWFDYSLLCDNCIVNLEILTHE